jgi:DNA-binding CsgD family transcriptional regulator
VSSHRIPFDDQSINPGVQIVAGATTAGFVDCDPYYVCPTDTLRLCDEPGVEPVPVRFTVANEEDAKRIVAVLGALGFKPEHVATMLVSFRVAAVADAHKLTPSETSVLARFVDGAPLGKIAAELGVSTHTVSLRMEYIHHKTGTSSEVELLRMVARS